MAIKEIKREWSPCQLGYVKEFLLHTEEDLKNMPRCSVGSKATVSETDNEYVKTVDGWMLLCDCDEDGGTGGGSGGVQPDWNQNDPNAADYVKNRTHWEASDGTVYPLDFKFLPHGMTTQQQVRHEVVWDSSMASNTSVSIGTGTGTIPSAYKNGHYYKVSDLTPTSTEMFTGDNDCRFNGQRQYNLLENYLAYDCDEGWLYCYNGNIAQAFFAVVRDVSYHPSSGGFWFEFPETGIYFLRDSTNYTTSLKWNGETTVINEQVIPSTIARTADLITEARVNELIAAALAANT